MTVAPAPQADATVSTRERIVLTAVCVVASLAAGRARPFTLPADVAVSVALLLAIAVVVSAHRLSRRLPSLARRPHLSGASTPSGPLRWLPWMAAVAAAASFEAYSVLSLPRSEHPTLSSMLDAADRTYGGHAVAFACWLVLGWYLVTR